MPEPDSWIPKWKWVCCGSTKLRSGPRPRAASSRRITRALLLAEPPSIDAGEITDKGYINQSAVLARRVALVERLYEAAGDPDVILLDEAPGLLCPFAVSF